MSRPQKIVWHGGDAHGNIMSDAYCDAWTDASPGRQGMGSSLITGQLLAHEEFSCNNHFILLCIEITSQYDLR
jgi:hypothetical protein